MKKRMILTAALALVLLACAGVGRARAYFTTFAEAEGGYTLTLRDRTELHEEFFDWTKHVTIENEEGSRDVYVRARATGPEAYPLVYSGDAWTLGDDGWYYYNEILHGGETTPELLVQITGVPADEYLQDGYSFQVYVYYQTTPVLYDENGAPYADWSDAEGGVSG